MKAPKPIWTSYIKANPYKSVVAAATLASLATAASFRPDWLFPLVGTFTLLTALVCYLAWRYARTLCLAVCILAATGQPVRAQRVAEAGPVLGGVVIVAGGAAAYLLWKFCQKHFPKTPPPTPPPPPLTNAPPVPTNSLPNTVGPTYALGVDIDIGSCPQNDQESTEPAVTSHITATVGPDGSLTSEINYGPAQSFSALQDQAAAYGLDITGHQQPPAMTINGQSGSSDTVTWLPDSRTVRVQREGETLYRVELEVSQDLHAWQPLARVDCAAGFAVTFSDTQLGSPWFYRVRSKLSD